MGSEPNTPYNTLPLLPPGQDLETKAVLKRCVTARAAVAELRRAGELIPDQSVLINTIPLLEAKDSSEIENIVTKLKTAAIPRPKKRYAIALRCSAATKH
jgi:Fic family protein